MLMYLFVGFKNFHPFYDQTQGFSAMFSLLYKFFIIYFNDHTFLQIHIN